MKASLVAKVAERQKSKGMSARAQADEDDFFSSATIRGTDRNGTTVSRRRAASADDGDDVEMDIDAPNTRKRVIADASDEDHVVPTKRQRPAPARSKSTASRSHRSSVVSNSPPPPPATKATAAARAIPARGAAARARKVRLLNCVLM